jgi:TRAP-type C4-dicarboxylate transport system substrate-binding protein
MALLTRWRTLGRMQTRRDFLRVLSATAAGGVLAACASQTPVASPISATSGVELVHGHFVPTSHEYHAQVLEPWARQVEQRSGGRIRITIHPGGALGPDIARSKGVAFFELPTN